MSEQPTIEESTTAPAHALRWLTESGLEAGEATRLMSASQHKAGREQASGACKVLFTLAHSTPHGFQQNTWTITRPLARGERGTMTDEMGLLRSYENGPRIWDATAVLPTVYALEAKGLIEPTGTSGAYRLTEAGRRELAGEGTS